jgi:hypothetical protein
VRTSKRDMMHLLLSMLPPEARTLLPNSDLIDSMIETTRWPDDDDRPRPSITQSGCGLRRLRRLKALDTSLGAEL